MPDHLVTPHGGTLVNLFADGRLEAELKAESLEWPSHALTPRQLCDLELLLGGGFSPLTGFMKRTTCERVCAEMRLDDADGTVWSIPITLDVSEELAKSLEPGTKLALRDAEGVMVAALTVAEVWQADRELEAEAVFGSTNREHPSVAYLLDQTQPFYVGGSVTGVQPVTHYDYKLLRHSPAELRAEFTKLGWAKVVAFQTRNPMHRAHQELTLRAAKEVGANLLIHPVVGLTKPGDVDHYTRVRCYQALLHRYPRETALLSLLPLAMRMGGPREAVWHAIIRKNYGCTHLIVGRDHAGPGSDSSGTPFYGPYDAQDLLRQHEVELGVTMVPFKMMVYVADIDSYVPVDEVAEGKRTLALSGTELRTRLADGKEIPEWFTFADVAHELHHSHPPRHRQGFTVFFTGLSGSGKSTIANALLVKFFEMGGRPVTVAGRRSRPGSTCRQNSDSRRSTAISIFGVSAMLRLRSPRTVGLPSVRRSRPYDAVRKDVRAMVQSLGGFMLVHVATPIEVCEQRDRKGLYAKARAGIIKEFTGISDPYEEPADADLVVDTTMLAPEEAAQQIVLYLEKYGYVDVKDDD